MHLIVDKSAHYFPRCSRHGVRVKSRVHGDLSLLAQVLPQGMVGEQSFQPCHEFE
jgi:hypothetical protein